MYIVILFNVFFVALELTNDLLELLNACMIILVLKKMSFYRLATEQTVDHHLWTFVLDVLDYAVVCLD